MHADPPGVLALLCGIFNCSAAGTSSRCVYRVRPHHPIAKTYASVRTPASEPITSRR